MNRNLNTPFVVEVTLRSCTCQGPVEMLGRNKHYLSAVKTAEGYWNVYLAFFGNLVNIVWFSIVDIRDGTVLWRNGDHTNEGKQRGNQEQECGRGRGAGTLGEPERGHGRAA